MYSQFVKILRIIQKLGFIASVILAGLYSSYFSLFTDKNILLIIPFLILSIIFCLANYITTQTVIAVIDLLNRIEHNTRNSRQN